MTGGMAPYSSPGIIFNNTATCMLFPISSCPTKKVGPGNVGETNVATGGLNSQVVSLMLSRYWGSRIISVPLLPAKNQLP